MDKSAEKEKSQLKQRIEILERENHSLKKSLFELSTRFNTLKLQPYQLGELLDNHHMDQSEFDMKSDEVYTLSKGEKSKHFYEKNELKGHTGAVYAVKYSSCGKFLATGSFDTTVRIWDSFASQKELACLKGHGLNVSELCWGKDSKEIVSGGYDQSCRIWDIERSCQKELYETDGFVQCVQFSPTDQNIFMAGTSRNLLLITDRRQAGAALTIKNESMVNAISVFNNGMYALIGDAMGYIKIFDIKTGKCLQSFLNESTKKPISHISVLPSTTEEEQIISVNSYDNVLRVYDLGHSSPMSSFTLLHAFKGYKNKNWPIKSSFYKFKENTTINGPSVEDIYIEPRGDNDRIYDYQTLLATGSADPYLYVYNIASDGSSSLLQRLEGHSDRVYTCDFHPLEPILASGSADFCVKIWNMNRKKK